MSFIIEHIEHSGLFWDCIKADFDVIEYADVYETVEDAKAELSRTNGQGFVRGLEEGEGELKQ